MQEIKDQGKNSSLTRVTNGQAVSVYEREMDIKLPLALSSSL